MQSPYEITSTEGETIDLLSGFTCKSSLVEAGKVLQKASNEFFNSEIANNAPRLIYLRRAEENVMLKSLARFLTDQYEDEVSESNLILTGGCSSAFIYLWTQLLPRNRKIIVASPTYQLLLNTLIYDLKYEVESIPEDGDGLKLDLVDEILKKEHQMHGLDEDFSCGIYIVPTFSNPTGMIYSEKFCKIITELAAKYNALVVTDDVYNLLYVSDHPPKRLLSFETDATRGHIVSSGSFSKYLSPSLRLGWIEAHSPLINRIKKWGIFQSANCLGQLSGLIVATAIDNGDAFKHIRYERANIKSRLETARSILKEKLPSEVKVSPSPGGYFIWISLPKNILLGEIQKRANEKNVLFLPGLIFTNLPNQNYLRISVARSDNLSRLKEGVEILCNIINDLK